MVENNVKVKIEEGLLVKLDAFDGDNESKASR